VKDTLLLTLGSKLEHNDFTGVEIQPSARIRWDMNETNMMWGAVSKAVRTPTIAETSTAYTAGILPPMPPGVPFPTAILINGSEAYDSETVWAYEMGYRTRPKDWLSVGRQFESGLRYQ
jgi:iron complex outermembrane receptor protein